MKLLPAIIAGLLAAQPAAATQMVQFAPAPAPGDCPARAAAGAADCAAISADNPGAKAPGAIGTGPLVAGLAGLLVLGLAFSRRRPGLPQVVS